MRRTCLAPVEQQLRQHPLALAVGYHHGYAFGSHLARYAVFGGHAATSERRTAAAYASRHIHVRFDSFYHLRCRIGRIAAVYAVYIAENHKGVGVRHRGHKPRQLVVVCEHQLAHAHSVVLIHHRHYPAAQHHLHAVLLVEVMAAGCKVLFSGQHLPAHHPMVAEQFEIAVYEFSLPHCAEKLPCRHCVEPCRIHAVTQLSAA